MDAHRNAPPLKFSSVDWVDRYCTKIGWREQRVKGSHELSEIIQAHIRSFPFDMLDYFLGIAPTIQIEAILKKFLIDGRGGGCSQQNALLHTMLGNLGVVSQLGMARVLRTDGHPSPRAHMILFVEMQSYSWLCDVGYGLFGPLQPILIEPGVVQQQGAHQFKIIPAGGELLSLARLSQNLWKPIYHFDRRTYDLPDFEPANFYNSLSPRSIFTKNLIVARPSLTGGTMIRNNIFATVERETQTRQRIESSEHLVDMLDRHFSISLRQADFVHLPSGLTPIRMVV